VIATARFGIGSTIFSDFLESSGSCLVWVLTGKNKTKQIPLSPFSTGSLACPQYVFLNLFAYYRR